MSRRTLILSLGLLFAACASACGNARPHANAADDRPEITLDSIRGDINNAWVRVPAADGKSEPISWVFARNEPKEIKVLDQKIEGDRATFLVEMQTRTAPRARNPRSLSGQLRLHYELRSGFVLRQWEIAHVENVSFTYVNEQPAEKKPAEEESGAKTRGDAGVKINAGDDKGAGGKANANRNLKR